MTEVPGFQPSQGFLADIQRITALNVFARAFPLWVASTGKTVSLKFTATLDGGVEVDLGMPASCGEPQANELMVLLEDCQRLADLQILVEEMRQSGVAAPIIQNYLMEGEALAQKLFPKA